MWWRLKSFDWFLWRIVLFACIWGLPKKCHSCRRHTCVSYCNNRYNIEISYRRISISKPFFSYTIVWESSLNIFQFCAKWYICFGNLHIGIVSENYSFFFFIYLNLCSRNKRLRGTLSILSKKLFIKRCHIQGTAVFIIKNLFCNYLRRSKSNHQSYESS